MKRVVGSSRVFNKQKASSTIWYTNSDDIENIKSPASSNKGFTLPHAATAFISLNHMDKNNGTTATTHQPSQQQHHHHLLSSRARWFLGLQNDPTENTSSSGVDVQKIMTWKEAYNRKVDKVKRLLEIEQKALQDKTNEFINIMKEADSSQTARIKAVYEKKTRKLTTTIRALQQKLDIYKSKLDQLEVLEEENNKRVRNRCGSVDNISSKLEVPKEQLTKKICVTLPRNSRYRSAEFLHSKNQKKVTSPDDEVDRTFQFSVGSDDEPTGIELSSEEFTALLSDVEMACKTHKELEELVGDLQAQVKQNREEWRSLLEESRYHGEHLEEQINDMMELHQHEVLNMKQELSSLEEKLDYQMDERTRDLQDLIDACQTKITKLELQQQQSITVESLDGFSMKVFATKLANILLSLFAIVLITISVVIGFFKSCFQNRLGRIINEWMMSFVNFNEMICIKEVPVKAFALQLKGSKFESWQKPLLNDPGQVAHSRLAGQLSCRR